MKLKIDIAVGIRDQHNGKRKTINRVATLDMQLSKTAIIKIPIDARGREYVDVKIERNEDEA